ncbi:riboflavin biosynthesis protein RibF [uncultured Holdemanella sp.]|uniref:riboflavin biosynthesis protein RibF n=1 Tax=uncultured Holdemanella sp. TaxID=1763549 RepID=UPI0025E85D45|nr:riboflavin biosynthesis protein RibF [uncultured Holdemanella sp.]
MEVIRIDYLNVPKDLSKSSCCIGFFDGLHTGHQALLENCIKKAKELNIQSGLITFDPDPWKIFFPERVCRHITTLQDRIHLANAMGIEVMYVITFSKDFAALDVDAFHMLLHKMNVSYITCGFDFKYASKNSGNVDTISSQNYFGVSVIESVNSKNEKISSSRIEPLIQSGKIDLANELLGYMYSIEGVVEHGFKRGSTLLKFPTANLGANPDYLVPSSGVYAGFVYVDDTFYGAMINVGNNPTFENKKVSIEAHIFDFDQDIYDQRVRFFFLKKTRNEIRFNGFEELKKQLESDIITCKKVILKEMKYIQKTATLWDAKVFEFKSLF